MTEAAAHHPPSGAVNAARPAQRPPAAAGSGPVPARGDEDSAWPAGRAVGAAERARIARDLDDVACKSLLGVAMAADSLASLPWSADRHVLDNELRELARLARQAVARAQSVTSGLLDDAPADALRGPEMARPLHAVSAPPPVRVVIADRNPVLRAGLRAVLDIEPTITVVAEAADTQDAVEQVRRHRGDVLLLDARMALPDGLATIRQLGQLTEVVMLDWTDDSSLVMSAAPAGASGYDVRGLLEPGELITVVLEAARRNPGVSRHPGPFLAGPRPAPERTQRSRPANLRPREREIMQFIAEGLSNRQIAARLVISEKTVKNHICSIYQRLGVHGRSQAISHWQDR